MVVLARSSRALRSRLGTVAVGLVLGGALGNLADRAFRGDGGFLQGGVVDFIDLQWWPVFNVADSASWSARILLVRRLRRAASPIEPCRGTTRTIPAALAGERLDRRRGDGHRLQPGRRPRCSSTQGAVTRRTARCATSRSAKLAEGDEVVDRGGPERGRRRWRSTPIRRCP